LLTPKLSAVARFWLTYKQFGRPLGVLILDAASLMEARMRANLDRIDQGAAFARGYRVDKEVAGLVPPTALGRLLDPIEYGELLRRLAAGTRKARRPLLKLG
jgi:hypothetical protein